MLYNIFKSNNLDVRLVGNIGNPPLLEKNIAKEKLYLLLRHHHIKFFIAIIFKTDHAAILNLSADHLERHGNINKYAKANLN